MAVETQIKKARKPRTPRAVTPLEASVLATLDEQKVTNAAIRGIAKAISGLTPVQAGEVLERVLSEITETEASPES
jgi:hypothetical protein